MKNAIQTILCLGLLAVGLALGAGCASWSSQEAVRINVPRAHTPVQYVENRNDPVEVVQFARTLSAAGRHREAAGIYLDAAARFQSVGGKFELDCRKEAVREYWLAGDLEHARQLLADLEAEQDIYRRAEEEKSLKRLRALLNSGQVAKSQ